MFDIAKNAMPSLPGRSQGSQAYKWLTVATTTEHEVIQCYLLNGGFGT